MLNRHTQESKEPVSELAIKLHNELLREGEAALTARYAEALVVIEYMWSQYNSASDKEQLNLTEDFVSEDSLPELFEEAMNNSMEKNPPRYDNFYDRCDGLYRHLRPIADSVDETTVEKKQGIVKLSERLHSDCAKEGGDIYKIITLDAKHREQD